MKFQVLIIVILSTQSIIGEATLSMLMRTLTGGQSQTTTNERQSNIDGNSYDTNYRPSNYITATTRAPTLGSIIGSAIDGLQMLQGMVMNPMMNMAANLIMMANARPTTAPPVYSTYAPPMVQRQPTVTYAAPFYNNIGPTVPFVSNFNANEGRNYYQNTESYNNQVTGSGVKSTMMIGTRPTVATGTGMMNNINGQDFNSGYYSGSRPTINNQQLGRQGVNKDFYNRKSDEVDES